MYTRVTEGVLIREFQRQVARLQRERVDLQDIVSSQKKLRAPSDDPVGAARATRLRGEARQLQALREGAGLGRAVLGAQDGALDQVSAILVRAREIATQLAGGLSSTANRQSAAEEVAELERGLLALANTPIAGRYLFGGLATGTAPFAAFDDPGFDPSTAYTGPAQPFSIRVATDETVRLTTPGNQVFGAAVVALDDLRQTLAAGSDPFASIDALRAASDTIVQERASVGGRLARLNDRDREIGSALDASRRLLADIEDADLTESIVELVQLDNVLNATLAAGRTLLETTILDYVRP